MHQKSIEEAKKRLFSGELVIFPTETVYGIGGNANNRKSIELIYKTKNRPINNPLICHFANIKEIEKNFSNTTLLEEHKIVVNFLEKQLSKLSKNKISKSKIKIKSLSNINHLLLELETKVEKNDFFNFIRLLHPSPALAARSYVCASSTS